LFICQQAAGGRSTAEEREAYQRLNIARPKQRAGLGWPAGER